MNRKSQLHLQGPLLQTGENLIDWSAPLLRNKAGFVPRLCGRPVVPPHSVRDLNRSARSNCEPLARKAGTRACVQSLTEQHASSRPSSNDPVVSSTPILQCTGAISPHS
ncbi:hypothetical protein PoB_001002600 [Plakobranchus ocellatus]|uniref:Uncharacterized protein n=1 Tax=Plakobranchus ocellatus TaxID=259542 RepID=A0AAV3YJU4_9GAST|nr:hypothetical protein PoB_001002600 [Plakobranchus ocellatus]